jgi:hypothetical protein
MRNTANFVCILLGLFEFKNYNFFSVAPIAAGQGACTAVNGDPCTFPFTFEGKTYSACTTVKNTVPWCRTKKGWGECVAGCPGAAAPPANIPPQTAPPTPIGNSISTGYFFPFFTGS